jgi:CO/xanthine dehydrogenase Mo-binding subunit
MSTVDVGQGSNTILTQIVAEVLHLPVSSVSGEFADTATTPPSHGTFGSSTTFSSGLAAKAAAEDVVAKLRALAGPLVELPIDDLDWDGRHIRHRVEGPLLTLADLLSKSEQTRVEGHASVQPGSTTHIINAFAAHFAEVEVDTETGEVRVLRIVAAHDCGRPIHRKATESQIRGGVIQALGYALMESMRINPNGTPYTGSFVSFRVPRMSDVPQVVPIIVDSADPVGPFGAKSVGEPAIVPTAAAIANAIYDATGARLTELPMTPARVLAALAEVGER